MTQLRLGIIIGGAIGFAAMVLLIIAHDADKRTDIESWVEALEQFADTCGDYGDGMYVPGLRAAAECIRRWGEMQ